MTRSEHLQWAKDRAKEYIDAGDTANAWASFASDMRKHDELTSHPALMIGMQRLLMGDFRLPADCWRFIQGFN